jgi:NAD(P)-dependent dehydrogenase (short-subunit alcohol dehydrogenase family)|tara:strand:+ start:1451 stop:2443 length:993 start_codon:yes stop_codon:yes gene_type:complete
MSKQQGPLDLEVLRGSIAVVTGAGNNGIGWGLCKHAAGLGMHVVAVDLHESLVRQAEERLRVEHPDIEVLGFAADVTRPETLEACLLSIQTAWPERRIGAVFANAGVIFNRTILKSTSAEWATTMNVNVLGVVNTIQAFVPTLRDQAGPSVMCTTASIGGLVRGDGGGAAYQASKHAVVALTESLSFELAVRSPQVHVHVLCPCIVQSALGTTSAVNAGVARGEVDASDLEPQNLGGSGLAMATERHAQQVFDHIAAGRFYMITDNVRPYVNHDHPFDGLSIVRERFENMMDLQLDNQDAWGESANGHPSAILKGPMWQELKRRARAVDD